MNTSSSKRHRQRTQKLAAAIGAWCPKRKYPDEETARRCLWAMGNRGADTSRLTVGRCRTCLMWHVGRVK